MNSIRNTLFVAACLVLPLDVVEAGNAGDGSLKTIDLPDPGHPLNGSWQVTHNPGTVVCPQMTMPIPAIDPETVSLAVHAGGTRVEMAAPRGRMSLRRVDATTWDSRQDGDGQVLRKRMRSDNAGLMARILEGHTTIYEGSLTPTAGMTIHYILGWARGKPDEIRGHLASTHQGCQILRSFHFRRGA
jgi:hypothetical protein